MSLDDIEKQIDNLPELYAKHGKKPGTSTISGNTCCLLGILSYELGHSEDRWERYEYWDRELGRDIAESLQNGFDGAPSRWSRDRRAWDIGRRAGQKVGVINA